MCNSQRWMFICVTLIALPSSVWGQTVDQSKVGVPSSLSNGPAVANIHDLSTGSSDVQSTLSNGKAASSSSPAMTGNEIDVIRSMYERKFDALDQRFQNELQLHRAYIEQQYSGLFSNMNNLFLAVLSLAVLFAGITGMAQWIYGSSKKEAVESVKDQASNAIRRVEEDTNYRLESIANTAKQQSEVVARERVGQLITEAHFEAEVQNLFRKVKNDVVGLKAVLLQQVKLEIISARDEVLSDRHAIIRSAIDEALQSKFQHEFDILSRLERIEHDLSEILKPSIGDFSVGNPSQSNMDFETSFSRILSKYAPQKS